MGPDTAFFLSGKAHVYYGAALIVLTSVWGATHSGSTGLVLAFVLIAIIAAGIFVDVWIHGYRH